MNINACFIGGRLTRDPELKFTPNSRAVCNFTIANNVKYKDGNGTWQEEVNYVDCVAWNKTAEAVGEYLKRGSPVVIQGSLKYETWKAKDTGENRNKLKLVASRVHFIPSSKSDDGSKPVEQGVPALHPEAGIPVFHPDAGEEEPPF